MTALPPSPAFEDFYRAVHGRDPFPWQRRLADRVHNIGWPREVGVPTGLGKTSAIDVAIWALAAQADRPPAERTAPTRLWYVVDRRLLVDAASDHAERLATLLEQPDALEPVAAVAERLRSIAAVGGRPALFVSRMRGGATLGLRPPDPAQPSVVCSTVAMYGSRLLFRGYGTTSGMWPIDAVHAGIDSLVLLDEAHLAEPLQQLVEVLPDCDANRTGVLRFAGRRTVNQGPDAVLNPARARPQLVALTATGRHGDRFDLDEEDRAHPVVVSRLSAAKPTRLVESTVKDLHSELAGQVRALLGELESPEAGAAVVFVNRPATARAVGRVLTTGRDAMDADVVILTGQLRDPDADRVRSLLLDPLRGAPSGANPVRERPLVVVATQTLEVGADLDFDVCVSETAGVRAITQRWGRLNRLGERPDARGALVHPVDAGAEGLYGSEPSALWERLASLGAGEVDLGPGRIAEILGSPQDRPERVGTLLPVHLWEAAKTTVRPAGEAPPEVFFSSIDEPDRRVSILWRSHLPGDEEQRRLVPPPVDAELVEVPVGELRAWLEDRPEVLAWAIGDDGVTLSPAGPGSIRSGLRVVLPVTAGGYGPSGWDPDLRDEVVDVSPWLRQQLWLTGPSLSNLLGRALSAEEAELLSRLRFDPEEGPDPEEDRAVAKALGDLLAEAEPHHQVTLGSPFQALRWLRIERLGNELEPLLVWESPRGWVDYPVDALDELSNAPAIGLPEHLRSVGELAGAISRRVGIDERLCDAITIAGRLHDLGKADERFQRRLGNVDGAPVAKSQQSPRRWEALDVSSGWPSGARHELLSVQLLDAALADGMSLEEPDLVRHLVISHHGQGRPACREVASLGVPTTIEFDGQRFSAVTDPGRPDWSQPARFRDLCERYGYWGLALMEACLRQADHTVSRSTPVEVL